MSIPSSPNTPVTLVGRERELGILRQHLDAALSGQGSLVLIGGEAGIGKTTLAEALCREATEQGAFALIGRCFDLTETPPYGPWVELFGRFRQAEGMPALPAAFAVRGTVGEVASSAALLYQVVDFLTALSADVPLLLLLDDLHWSDPASLDLLRFLARNVSTLPILTVVTYRSDELTRRRPLYPLIPVLVRESAAARIDLRVLGAADVAALVADRYGLGGEDAGQLVGYLHERAEGNPFFLDELLRTLEEAGVMRTSPEGWTLGDLTQVRVPLLLRQVIDGRLGRLDEEHQRLLGIAAVIGQEVPLGLWSTVAALDEDTLLAVHEHAIEAHLLTETPSGMQVRFAHALIREALYEGVPSVRRRRLHRNVGETLAAGLSPDPDMVAHHFQRAGDERAAVWLVEAGERAQRAAAWLTAAARFEAALALMPAVEIDAGERGWLHYRIGVLLRYVAHTKAVAHMEQAARLAAESDDPALAAHAQYYRGHLHCVIADFGPGIRLMEEGLRAVEALSAAATASLVGSGVIAQNTGRSNLISMYAYVGRFDEARDFAEQYLADTIAHVVTGTDAAFDGPAHLAQAFAFANDGHILDARRAFAAACGAWHAADFPMIAAHARIWELLHAVLPYQADDVPERERIAAEAERAWATARDMRAPLPQRFARVPLLVIEGWWDEAHALALLGYQRAGVDAPTKWSATLTMGAIALGRGDATLVTSLTREWMPDGSATLPGATPYFLCTVLLRLSAAVAIETDDLGVAREWLVAHDRWLDWGNGVLGRSEGHLSWAALYRAKGDRVAARRSAEAAVVCATLPRQPLALVAAHRFLGELDTEVGRYDYARPHLEAALALANACAAPYERALTLLAMAELRFVTGDTDAAQALLIKVLSICKPIGAKPALARADALFTLITAKPDTPTAFPDGLSAREVDVLRLIASGLNNQEIADTLSLSIRTVERHITNIYGKIAARSRADAAVYALRRLT